MIKKLKDWNMERRREIRDIWRNNALNKILKVLEGNDKTLRSIDWQLHAILKELKKEKDLVWEKAIDGFALEELKLGKGRK